MDAVLESIVLIIVVFGMLIPHELAHKLTFRYYGIKTHFEIGRTSKNRASSLFIEVVPEGDFSIDNKAIRIIAASGGITGTFYIVICYVLSFSLISVFGSALLLVFIIYSVFYTIWETKWNWNAADDENSKV